MWYTCMWYTRSTLFCSYVTLHIHLCCLDVRNQARHWKFVGHNKIERKSSDFLLCFQIESKDFIAEIFLPASSSSYVANP